MKKIYLLLLLVSSFAFGQGFKNKTDKKQFPAEILEIDHLKLYKMIGYTNKDLKDILDVNIKPKINNILGALEQFDEAEFELIERYIELLKRK